MMYTCVYVCKSVCLCLSLLQKNLFNNYEFIKKFIFLSFIKKSSSLSIKITNICKQKYTCQPSSPLNETKNYSKGHFSSLFLPTLHYSIHSTIYSWKSPFSSSPLFFFSSQLMVNFTNNLPVAHKKMFLLILSHKHN